MKELTPEQRQILDKRYSHFELFLAERMDVLADFFERIGVGNPEKVVTNADDYLPFLEQFLLSQDVTSFAQEDKSFLRARLIYFIGELYIQRYGGHWLVHENPDSPQFARYVVGGFSNRDRNLTVDPAAVAQAYLEGETGGGLIEHLHVLDRELAPKI